jgi:hypothetical protein
MTALSQVIAVVKGEQRPINQNHGTLHNVYKIILLRKIYGLAFLLLCYANIAIIA